MMRGCLGPVRRYSLVNNSVLKPLFHMAGLVFMPRVDYLHNCALGPYRTVVLAPSYIALKCVCALLKLAEPR